MYGIPCSSSCILGWNLTQASFNEIHPEWAQNAPKFILNWTELVQSNVGLVNEMVSIGSYSWSPVAAEAPPHTGCPLYWLYFQLALEVPVQQLLVVASPHPLLWVHPVASSFSRASNNWTRLLPAARGINVSSAVTQQTCQHEISQNIISVTYFKCNFSVLKVHSFDNRPAWKYIT